MFSKSRITKEEMEKTFQNVIQNSKRNTRYRWFTIIILIILLSILVLLFVAFFSLWLRNYLKRDRLVSVGSDSDDSSDDMNQLTQNTQKKSKNSNRNSKPNVNRDQSEQNSSKDCCKKKDNDASSLAKTNENENKYLKENEETAHDEAESEKKVNSYKSNFETGDNSNSKFKKNINTNNNNSNQYGYFVNDSFQNDLIPNSKETSFNLSSNKFHGPTSNNISSFNLKQIKKSARDN